MKRIFLFPTIEEGKSFILTEPHDPVFISGVGMAQTAATIVKAVKAKKPDLIILAGFAGTYDSDLALGEVVEVVEERVVGIPERYNEIYENETITALPLVASNTVCSSGAEAGDAEIENMEGAALFAVCKAFGIKCSQIRAVSNRVGQPFEEWETELAAKNLTEQLTKLFN